MAYRSSIEWTDATWNPVTGCKKVSPACAHCYAERFAERFRGVPGHPYSSGFDVVLRPERLQEPFKWRAARMVFVCSMSDLFQQAVPDSYIERVFTTMEQANWHLFQVLTKRPGRLRLWAGSRYYNPGVKAQGRRPWPRNVWVGTSVESQGYVSRIGELGQVQARRRFLSLEPLLGAVRLPARHLKGIHWVIVGGESGPAARRLMPEWLDAIFDDCRTHGIPFFFKQWGEFDESGRRLGKKRAGRTWRGRTWSEIPEWP